MSEAAETGIVHQRNIDLVLNPVVNQYKHSFDSAIPNIFGGWEGKIVKRTMSWESSDNGSQDR